MSRLSLLAIWAAVGTGVFAQNPPKNRTTPMPPKTKFDPTARLEASADIPDPIGDYVLTVTGEINGQVIHTGSVPTYYFEDTRLAAGSAPIGSEWKPDVVKVVASHNYFGTVPPKDPNAVPGAPSGKTIWIDGRFLKISKR